jgi:ubiquinone/menaquinone biosynthesis C-methylase UbiE
MAQPEIRFEDGAAYEEGMGRWSRLAGNIFLDWLAPAPGLRWIDVGCGSGAFTQLLIEQCAPSETQGVDPSEAQLAFARQRPGAQGATFQLGDAMALPFAENRFDAAVMALVIFFVPDPDKGVAEMLRVVKPGGLIAAYAWNMAGGGFPFEPIRAEVRAMGFEPPQPPSGPVSRMEALRETWQRAGLQAIETREITVQRTFASFDEFWAKSIGTGGSRAMASMLTPDVLEQVRARVQAKMPVDTRGHITCSARANAIKGLVPAR